MHWSAFHVVKSLGNLLAGRIADRVSPRPFILTGWLIHSVIYLAFALITTAWQAWLLFLLYAIFYSLTEPAEKKLVTHLVSGDQKGAAFGWFDFAIGMAALPSGVRFGWLYEQFGPLIASGWGTSLALPTNGFFKIPTRIIIGKHNFCHCDRCPHCCGLIRDRFNPIIACLRFRQYPHQCRMTLLANIDSNTPMTHPKAPVESGCPRELSR